MRASKRRRNLPPATGFLLVKHETHYVDRPTFYQDLFASDRIRTPSPIVGADYAEIERRLLARGEGVEFKTFGLAW